jgi:glycosyltransferase involved in cell wall biosynthesis
MRLISIIIPTYNSENIVNKFYERLTDTIKTIENRYDFEIIYINDFSTDNTNILLSELSQSDSRVRLLNFSRNFGNQNAITAGLNISKGSAAIIIDDDLQDPPELIIEFLKLWENGYKVVYGYRPNRQGISLIFNTLTKIYYTIINSLSEINIPLYTGDFRLIDKTIIDILNKMPEESKYYRGLVSWVGYPQTYVEYTRDRRYAGKSNFSFKKYLSFAINGITAFTDKPLYLIFYLGLILTIVGFLGISGAIILRLIDPHSTIMGWTSLAVLVIFFGGIQIFTVGVVSLYVARIYKEVKKRPPYLIDTD